MPEPFAVIKNGTLIEATNADAVVPWWSFTKTVIAAAALVLVQQQRLMLDEPLAGRRYTLRQLLAHRAGLTDNSPSRPITQRSPPATSRCGRAA